VHQRAIEAKAFDAIFYDGDQLKPARATISEARRRIVRIQTEN